MIVVTGKSLKKGRNGVFSMAMISKDIKRLYQMKLAIQSLEDDITKSKEMVRKHTENVRAKAQQRGKMYKKLLEAIN